MTGHASAPTHVPSFVAACLLESTAHATAQETADRLATRAAPWLVHRADLVIKRGDDVSAPDVVCGRGLIHVGSGPAQADRAPASPAPIRSTKFSP